MQPENSTLGAPTLHVVASANAPVLRENQITRSSVDLSGNTRVSLTGMQPAADGLGSTSTLAVTDIVPVAVRAASACSIIIVQEDASVPSYPTTSFNVMRPASVSTAIRIAVGHAYMFRAPLGQQWQPGQIVGYIQLPATGSTTFSKDEQQ